jgi:protein-S-isoprenylcysteine O-methyltransferase Ste14
MPRAIDGLEPLPSNRIMTARFMFLEVAVRVTMTLCWLTLGIALLLRRRAPDAPERTRNQASMIGLGLQSVATAMTFLMRRQRFTPFLPLGAPTEVVLAVATIALGVGSAWVTLAAIRTLGKQWSLAARLVEGHTLVTEGPFRVVRHPIYTAMFGMLLANGVAVSYTGALLPAIIVYWIGAAIRIRREEKLLRQAFGQEFEAHARRVPAVFPRLHRLGQTREPQ